MYTSLAPAAILAIVLVVMIFLACILAGMTTHSQGDNGLNREGTYQPAINRQGRKQ